MSVVVYTSKHLNSYKLHSPTWKVKHNLVQSNTWSWFDLFGWFNAK